MRYLLVIAITLLFWGCGESEEPLDENVNEEDAVVSVGSLAPEAQTFILRTLSREFIFNDNIRKITGDSPELALPENIQKFTNVGTPTTVYHLKDGLVAQIETIFNKEYYHLEWFWMDDELVLVNLLEQRIPFISDEAAWEHLDDLMENNEEAQKRYDEILAEEGKKWDDRVAELGGNRVDPAVGWVDVEGEPIEIGLPEPHSVADDRWEEEFSIHPFWTRWYNNDGSVDEIEVIIKHQSILKVKTKRRVLVQEGLREVNIGEREVKMLFVRVLRNLTRPHITYPHRI